MRKACLDAPDNKNNAGVPFMKTLRSMSISRRLSLILLVAVAMLVILAC